MDRLIEQKEIIMRFYAKYSRFIDKGIQFVLALTTFLFIGSNIGFMKTAGNPVVTLGLAVICTFLPVSLTILIAAMLTIVHFYALSLGVMAVTAAIFLIMFVFYLRFVPDQGVIILLTPIVCTLKMPVLIPIACGLIGGPVCVVPVAFGTIVYYMLTYVKAYETTIKGAGEGGMVAQVSSFIQQVFNNRSMWMVLIAFTLCILVVYSIRRMSVEHAWKVAIVSGALVYIFVLVLGKVAMNVTISYLPMIIGTLGAVLLAFVLEFFVFSVDYSRTEILQFEDDEYFYYVKAVPKVTVAAPEKTVKRIIERQETAAIPIDTVKNELKNKDTEMLLTKSLEEELEIEKLLEEELKH